MKKSYKMAAILLFIAAHINLFSQKLDSSSTLAIVPFKEAFEKNDDDNDYGRILAEKVLTAIEQSKRFNIIDRTDFETIIKEVEGWEGKYKSDFKNKKINDEALYWYGNRLKADFIMTGTIVSLESPLITITGSYKAIVGFTIKAINVRTNKVYVTEDFNVNSGNFTKTYSTKGEAIAAALANMNEPVKKFIDRYFPNYAKYLRTEELDRTEMKKVLIGSGSDRGFRLKQKLDIVLYNTNGLPPEDIGDAEIIAVQPDHSLIKILSVKKGKAIEQIPNKGEILYFRSKPD